MAGITSSRRSIRPARGPTRSGWASKASTPSLFFDDDGTAWLVNNGLPQGKLRYEGHRAIWIQQFDVSTMKLVGPRKVIVDGGANPAARPEYIEGPHLFRRDGYYYLTAAEGGTGEQHAEMVFRSRTVTGPYVPWAGNPTLTQRDLAADRAHPVTSTGHAQLVELKDGSWWAVFLATRPYRGNQYNLGRETFLLPVTWRDGWPVILARGERVPLAEQRPALPHDPQATSMSGAFRWSERFRAPRLPMPWMTIDVPRRSWYATGSGGLRIEPSATPLDSYESGQAAYIAHRLQHHKAMISMRLDGHQLAPGEQAGLALLQNETHFYAAGLTRDPAGSSLVLYRRNGKDDPPAGVALRRVALGFRLHPFPVGRPAPRRLLRCRRERMAPSAAGAGCRSAEHRQRGRLHRSDVRSLCLSAESGRLTPRSPGLRAWRDRSPRA